MKAKAHSQTRAKVLEQIVHDSYNRRTRATRYRVRQWAQLLKPGSRVITEVHAARPKGAATFSTPYISQRCHPGTLTLLHHRRHHFWGSCKSRTSPGWKTKQNTAATAPLGGDGLSATERGTGCASERETWSPVRAKATSSDPATHMRLGNIFGSRPDNGISRLCSACRLGASLKMQSANNRQIRHLQCKQRRCF